MEVDSVAIEVGLVAATEVGAIIIIITDSLPLGLLGNCLMSHEVPAEETQSGLFLWAEILLYNKKNKKFRSA